MYKLTVLYTEIADRDGFDEHFHGVHLPLAASTPLLRDIRVTGYETGEDGPPAVPVIVELLFDSPEDADTGMKSDVQKRAMEDFVAMAGTYGVQTTVLRGAEEHVQPHARP